MPNSLFSSASNSNRSSAASNLSVNAATGGTGSGGSGSNLAASSNLSTSFHSGPNPFGLNNSYATAGGGVANLGGAGLYGGGVAGGGYGKSRDIPSWLGKNLGIHYYNFTAVKVCSRPQCYKTLYVRNLRLFVIS